jgi:shikimate kinase
LSPQDAPEAILPNLVLIGYRGTGKSTIGRALSARLGLPYLSLDEEIVRRAGRSIPEIVAASGWDRFRDLESEVVRDAAAVHGRVLDTGGGVVLRPENVERLRRSGVLFLLRAQVKDIVKRIGGDAGRPSLTGTKSSAEEVEEVLAQRKDRYEAAADEVVDTSALAADAAVERIAASFRRRAAAGGHRGT